MKKLILIAVLVACTLLTKAQDTLKIPLKDGKIFYEQVVAVPDMPKAKLFKNVKLWYVNSFKDSKSVIENENLNDGNIIGKGFTEFIGGKGLTQTTLQANFTISIDIQDNKYRIRIYNITGDEVIVSYQKMYQDVFIDNKKFARGTKLLYLTQFNAEMYRIFSSIKASVGKDDSF